MEQSPLKTGQQIVAVGDPGGERNVITNGIISKQNATIPLHDSDGVMYGAIIDSLMFDAAATGGNSGGPLLNMNGKVVGMVQSEFEGTDSNYAISYFTINQVVPSLIQNGKFEHPWIGFGGVNYDPSFEFYFPPMYQDSTIEHACVVTKVYENGPAHNAGIQSGSDSNRIIVENTDTGLNADADIFDGFVKLRYNPASEYDDKVPTYGSIFFGGSSNNASCLKIFEGIERYVSIGDKVRLYGVFETPQGFYDSRTVTVGSYP